MLSDEGDGFCWLGTCGFAADDALFAAVLYFRLIALSSVNNHLPHATLLLLSLKNLRFFRGGFGAFMLSDEGGRFCEDGN